MDILSIRKKSHDCNDLFLKRWSPRAMSGEALTQEELFTLFEAARWAPSSFNNQPWRFVYATKNSPHWDAFVDLLAEPNKVWCAKAGALVVVVSKNTFDYNNKPSRTHALSTGAAWENLALQGSFMDLVVHGMAGFDYDKAAEVVGMPKDHTVEMMIAVGKPGKKEDLPAELQEREVPTDRKPLSEITFEGKMQ